MIKDKMSVKDIIDFQRSLAGSDYVETEEMEEEEIKRPKASVLDVRDRLVNILDLITVATEALEHSQLINIKQHVVHVLYFHVKEQIRLAEEELAQV